MRRLCLSIFALSLLLLLFLPNSTSGQESRSVDAAQYQEFQSLVEQLYTLQNPTSSRWDENSTKQMYQILERLQEMKSKGFVLEKSDQVLKTLNRLIENMHAHCLVLSCAANPGTVLLRVGKTPDHLEFGGLLAEKVSDFDMTLVGKKAAKARDLHLNLLNKHYGPKFVEMTLTDLALADSTIAAWSLQDIETAYRTAVLNPEMHRSYSGLQFVEDYILKVGEISQMGEDGKLLTRKLESFPGPGLDKQKQQFIQWSNEAFEKSGHKIRFGKRYSDFCLGLVSDISNQMWMNLDKEMNRENPHNVVKKYLQRYVAEIKTRVQIDISREAAYGKIYDELQDLIHQCENKQPEAWAKLRKKMADFEGYIRGTVAQKQAALYAEAVAAGKSERAAAILLDTKGAMQNWEILGHNAPTGALGKLGEQAARELAENPLFVEPRNWNRYLEALKNSVFDYESMKKYLAQNKGAIFLQVGSSLFVLHDALQKESAGEKGALAQAIQWEAFDQLMFTALPMALEFAQYRVASATLGLAGGVFGLAEIGYESYQNYLYASLRAAHVEPKIIARLAGITPEGNRIEGSDVITALGAPLSEEELAAPAQQPLGWFDGGTLQVWKREDGAFVFEKLLPHLKEEWEAHSLHISQNWDKRELWPVRLQNGWERSTLTPGEIIAERRLNRIFEILRREYVAKFPNPSSQKVPKIDTSRLQEPFLLNDALQFDRPVYREEIFYYWKKYNEAAIQGAVMFNESTSVFRTAGQELEKDLAESSLRRFLEKMATLAAQSDAAREAYEAADAPTLEAFLRSKAKIHFDGRDIAGEEIQNRVQRLRRQALDDAQSKHEIWMDWLRQHWFSTEFSDLRELQVRILSVQTVPDGEDYYKIQLRYEVNKAAAVDFHFYHKASSGIIYLNNTQSGRLDQKPTSASSGPFSGTVEYSTSRNDRGEDNIYYVEAVEPFKEKVYTKTADIVIPGLRRAWIFERCVQVKGEAQYEKKPARKSDDSWSLSSEIEGSTVRLVAQRINQSNQAWSRSELFLGPMPTELLNGSKTGVWIEVHSSTHEGTYKVNDSYFTAELLALNQDGKFSRIEDVARLYGDATEDALAEARELKLPSLRPVSGENAQRRANLRTFEIRIDRYQPPKVKKYMAKIQVNGGFECQHELHFEWNYKLGNSGASDSSSATANPWQSSVNQARQGTGSSAGSEAQTNPWQQSLEQARESEVSEQILSSPTPWNFPQVQAVMDEWLATAKPPIHDGTPWRYTEWGVLENGINVKAMHPDNQGMSRHQYLWEKCQRLTSANHCTLGEFIRCKISGESLEDCQGKLSAAAAPLKVGAAAPLFEAKTIYGNKTIRLEDLRGQSVLFFFWNPSVKSEQEHFQYLNNFLKNPDSVNQEGFTILSTAPSSAQIHPDLKAVVEKLKQLRVDEIYPDVQVVNPYLPSVKKTPTLFFIDPQGRISEIFYESPQQNEKLERYLFREINFNRKGPK